MKYLNNDKIYYKILMWIIILIITGFVLIVATVHKHNTTPPKQYDLECVTQYVKYPFEECIAKEAE